MRGVGDAIDARATTTFLILNLSKHARCLCNSLFLAAPQYRPSRSKIVSHETIVRSLVLLFLYLILFRRCAALLPDGTDIGVSD
jgi:hypothetical protein